MELLAVSRTISVSFKARSGQSRQSFPQPTESSAGSREGGEATLRAGILGTSLAVQWLGLGASPAGGTGSIPGRGTKILHAVQRGQK